MNKLLKILFITNNYTPYSGGLVTSIQASVAQLQSLGHQPMIATLDFLGDAHQDPEYVYRLQCPIKFKYNTNYMAVPWRATEQLVDLVQRVRPDIVHLHHPFLLGIAGLHAARRNNVPVVFTYHTRYEKYAHYVPLIGQMAAPLIVHRVKRFCNQVDGIIAPSAGVKDELINWQIDVPIAVIPSGLRSQFLECKRDFRDSHSGPFRLLYVGRLTQEKNILFLFDLYAKLPAGKYSLSLVGYGAKALEYKMYAYQTLGLDHEMVQFIESPNNLVDYYAHADLFLFPSTTDTQGIVLAESLSQGLPIVALPGYGQEDSIIHGKNGYICHSEREMIEHIERIAADGQLHARLQQGAVASSARYAPVEVIHQLIRFYHEILGK